MRFSLFLHIDLLLSRLWIENNFTNPGSGRDPLPGIPIATPPGPAAEQAYRHKYSSNRLRTGLRK
jgi:hypothetical protein